jgi:hypothetical protein
MCEDAAFEQLQWYWYVPVYAATFFILWFMRGWRKK